MVHARRGGGGDRGCPRQPRPPVSGHLEGASEGDCGSQAAARKRMKRRMSRDDTDRTAMTPERRHVLRLLERRLQTPMMVLSVVWTVLLVLELVRGLSPFLEWVGIAIWIAFAFEFALGFVLADGKAAHLRREWATVLALLAPGLRMLRAARVVRVAGAARGLRLLNVFASVSHGMSTLGRSLSQRGFGYVAALTVLIIL